MVLPADDCTVAVFVIFPNFPDRSTVSWISPLSPGAMGHGCLGSLATVQPHEGWTWLMTTSDLLMFVNANENFACVSPGWGLIVFSFESHAKTSGPAAGGAMDVPAVWVVVPGLTTVGTGLALRGTGLLERGVPD